MRPVEVVRGEGPVVLGFPHSGTYVPKEVFSRLNTRGRALSDTDWHVDRLYAGLLPEVTSVRATFHRYVIDANRDPEGKSLYPGQNTTGLVPTTDFDGLNIWNASVDNSEKRRFREQYHAVYHAALEEEMRRVAGKHGFAILYDCHSIRGEIPFLFNGLLPDLNIGTNLSTTCDPGLETLVTERCKAQSAFSMVQNGRFLGGWTTRHYGRPQLGWHAIQMEIAQRSYLKEEHPPWSYDRHKAAALRPLLSAILADLSHWRPA